MLLQNPLPNLRRGAPPNPVGPRPGLCLFLHPEQTTESTAGRLTLSAVAILPNIITIYFFHSLLIAYYSQVT